MQYNDEDKSDNGQNTVKFKLCDDVTVDDEERYLHEAGKSHYPTTVYTYDDADCSIDRLDSNDYFNTPEAHITEPKLRAKRQSLEKKKNHASSSIDEKESKKRLQIAREQKALTLRLVNHSEQSIPKRKSLKNEAKLRQKSRSLERDLKPTHESNSSFDRLTVLLKGNGEKKPPADDMGSLTPPDSATPIPVSPTGGKRSPEEISKEIEYERKQFHKQFVLDVKLGTRTFKEREDKSRRHNQRMPFQRQQSEIILHNGKDRLNFENLFIALQAYRKRLDADGCIRMADEVKNKIPDKIDQLYSFQFTPESNQPDIGALLSDPFSIPEEYLYDIEVAIDSVKEVTETIDSIQSLFPTHKFLVHEFPECGSKRFKKAVGCLNMWLTNAQGLVSTLKAAGNIAGIQKLSFVPWPFLERNESQSTSGNNTSTLNTPAIIYDVATSPDSSSADVNHINHRKVRFDASNSLSNSPVQSSFMSTSHDGHMDRIFSTSYSSVDVMSAPTSIYRPAVDKMLRKMSLQQMIEKKSPSLIKGLLKAKYAIMKMEVPPSKHNSNGQMSYVKRCGILPVTSHDLLAIDEKVMARESDGEVFPSYNDEFTRMRLPSLLPMYIFLARFPLDLVHECVRLRMEQQIDRPSVPILRQVVHECSEAAKVALSLKQTYQYFLAPVIKILNLTDAMFEKYIEPFSVDLDRILEDYFKYIEYGMDVLFKEAFAVSLKSFLEEEWVFSKEICPFIPGGMAEAGKRFCNMTSTLLTSINIEMEQLLDESLFKPESSAYAYESPSSSSNSELSEQSRELFDMDGVCTSADYRQLLIRTCREIKSLFGDVREKATKALEFARLLRKDLEIAAEFRITSKFATFMEALQSSGHVKVDTPRTANYMVFVSSSLRDDKNSILTLLDVTCGREDVVNDPLLANSPREGYLLLVHTNDTHTSVKWMGQRVKLESKTETAITLSHIGVPCGSLYLIVTHSSFLFRQSKEFKLSLLGHVKLVNEQTTCHQAIAEAWQDLRVNAFSLASGVTQAIEHVETHLESTDLTGLESLNDIRNVKAAYRETLQQCYSFGFDFLQELNRLNTRGGSLKHQSDSILLGFAQQWMKFVVNTCERGKGTRPRWASSGFEFLSLVTEPSITKYLSNEEFAKLKKDVSATVSHIIGEPSNNKMSPVLVTPKPDRILKNSPHNSQKFPLDLSVDNHVRVTTRQTSNGSGGSSIGRLSLTSEPSTPLDKTDSCRVKSRGSTGSLISWSSTSTTDFMIPRLSGEKGSNSSLKLQDSPNFPVEMLPPDRAQAAVVRVDHSRDTMLQQKHVIGRVVEGHHRGFNIRLNVKRVNFKWQRGFKIGEGMFGTVYSAINCDTEEMMALKEIRFKPNDVQTIKLIADEIKNFEGIDHPNLVKYYGVEVHKEEMFIFMEYCNEGTLELKSKLGLTESLIRRYTKELVIAVEFLHENNIVHRDIKGANIFLVPNDKLKLGDFGCSAKLKGHTTMPGEMVQFVGTAAYMAPEVITQKGHGRAADIWSLGCVVVEMATGKRPWHELENLHQIMFKVGIGNVPQIPDNFHSEGKDFLHKCFEIEPTERSTANDLLGHVFIKVD